MHIKAISSASNPELKALRSLHKSESTSFAVEGHKLIDVAIQAGFMMESYWITDETMLDQHKVLAPVRQLPQSLYLKISPTKKARGPLGVFKKKSLQLNPFASQSGRFLLIDSIQDPGNAGALIRAAKAFGLSGIIWYGSRLNLYHHALIRASAGSCFLVEHYELNDTQGSIGFPVLGTVANGGICIDTYSWPESFILCLGNEGHGLSETIEKQCTETISIPIHKMVESLNVAGAAHILLYMAQKNN